mmetsp:Transcript_12440/g.17767  ORF Transcript_12440/g.17767 Transcript_12440/m.17767 type:complete len:266 (-) Transcript_12440:131-928(-)
MGTSLIRRRQCCRPIFSTMSSRTFRRVSLWHIAVPAAEWVKATSPMLTQRVRFLLRAITASQQHFKICSGISIATIVKIYEGRRIRARFGVSISHSSVFDQLTWSIRTIWTISLCWTCKTELGTYIQQTDPPLAKLLTSFLRHLTNARQSRRAAGEMIDPDRMKPNKKQKQDKRTTAVAFVCVSLKTEMKSEACLVFTCFTKKKLIGGWRKITSAQSASTLWMVDQFLKFSCVLEMNLPPRLWLYQLDATHAACRKRPSFITIFG